LSGLQPSKELAAFAERILGDGLTFEHRGWNLKVSKVWRVTATDGRACYLKQHEEARLHRQDVHASAAWVPLLPAVAPRLVASDLTLLAALFTEVRGRVMSEVGLTEPDQRVAYRQAGMFARELHSLPLDIQQPSSPPARMRTRMERSCEEARDLIDGSTLKWALDAIGDGSVFDGERLVPCHRDYSPRNWLVDFEGVRLVWGVIDFERGYPDSWLFDVQRMWNDEWVSRPDLKEAFFDGYGRNPTQIEVRQVQLICLRMAIGTVSWATRYGDLPFARWARGAIERLKREM
jgi:Ser/Thr protein kinase RdoA (MazF antagonist)